MNTERGAGQSTHRELGVDNTQEEGGQLIHKEKEGSVNKLKRERERAGNTQKGGQVID